MQLFAELAHLVDTELLEHSSIEWEERIYLHTVMVKNLSMETNLPNRATVVDICAQSARANISSNESSRPASAMSLAETRRLKKGQTLALSPEEARHQRSKEVA